MRALDFGPSGKECMAKGRNSTGFGLRMHDDLLAAVGDLAQSSGFTRNELIVELVRLGLDSWERGAPPTVIVQPKPVAVGVVGRESVKVVVAGHVTRRVKVKGVRRE